MKGHWFRYLAAVLAAWGCLEAQAPATISANRLKGDLSFLSSDALAGRFSPSTGLDAAAEFIASRFRAMGLQPLPNGTYFQEARMIDRNLPKPTGPLRFHADTGAQTIPAEDYTVWDSDKAEQLTDVPVVFLRDPDSTARSFEGYGAKAVVIPARRRDALKALQKSGVAAVIVVSKSHHAGPRSDLFEANTAATHAVPVLVAHSKELEDELEKPDAVAGWKVTVAVPGPEDREVNLRNVGAIVPGSDPSLKKQVVMLTAHYDHIGTAQTAAPFAMSEPTAEDRIYNGANDDGSGTVSVIAIADALRLSHPKRTILFLTFFGEERGLIGSGYYAHHPLFPLAATAADINLEQVGRIDGLEKGVVTPHPKSLTLTGFTFTNLAAYLRRAGIPFGVNVYENKENSDPFFLQSDNAALSSAGVPSTTVCTAFEYPDYHAVGDEWQKIDYPNMARVDRAIAQAVLAVANSAVRPQWNTENPKTVKYREAFESLEKTK